MSVRRWIIRGLFLLGVAVIVLLVILFWPKDSETPVQEKRIPMGGVSIPLPEGWQTKSEPGVTYAVKSPCASLACAGVAVFHGDGLTGGWRKIVLDHYACTGNKQEKAGPVTQKGTPQFGEPKQGTIQYTVSLCGVSGSEVLDIWEARLPARIVVAPVGTKNRLPDVEKRLNRSEW